MKRFGLQASLVSLFAAAIAWQAYAFTRKAVKDQAAQPPALTEATPVAAAPVMLPTPLPETHPHRSILERWCADLDAEVHKLGWPTAPCDWRSWRLGGFSVEGRPLVYAEFGARDAENTTLILSMVHPDEITPLHIALELVQWMEKNERELHDVRVVIAPLVNPDGFYRSKKTRVNANGVDVNRNFATNDWNVNAIKLWKSKYGSNPRRYPGPKAGSEPETVFQAKLIDQSQPQKVLSVHSPLNFMDYDGPTLALDKFPKEYIKKCLELRSRLKAQSGGFFPGSLGNYAGQEKGIPTLTLELPTANAGLAGKYWTEFKSGIQTLIGFEVPTYVFSELEDPSKSSVN